MAGQLGVVCDQMGDPLQLAAGGAVAQAQNHQARELVWRKATRVGEVDVESDQTPLSVFTAAAISASGLPDSPCSWTVAVSCPRAKSSLATRRWTFSSSLSFKSGGPGAGSVREPATPRRPELRQRPRG